MVRQTTPTANVRHRNGKHEVGTQFRATGRAALVRCHDSQHAFPQSSGMNRRKAAMLILRPNCERCDTDLPPDSRLARICSFECTFCADCTDGTLGGACPNCGGELLRRPIRPVAKLEKFPAATERKLAPRKADSTSGRIA
jgi:hypothetical protein